MNCEMAQRTIALAALAPASGRAATAEYVEVAGGTEQALAELEADFFAEHPDLAQSRTAPAADHPGTADLDAEVPEDARRALEAHLAGCRECQAEMAATAAFYRALSLTRHPEPTPSLVARARMRLDATLDDNAHQSAIAHLLQQISFSAGRLRAAPGLASGLLLLGLVAGGYGGYRAGHAAHNQEQRSLVLEHAPDQHQVIADISSITREPGSEQVEVSYDRLVPDTLSGSLDDPSIRRLLVLGTESGADAAVRNDSLDLLANECRNGHQCSGGPVRNALLSALRIDPNPEVRAEALAGLEPYIAEDMQVRDAILHAVMADKSADVRIEAIRLLTPVEVDSSVRHALHTVAAQDGDPSIRNASQQLLNGMPQVQ